MLFLTEVKIALKALRATKVRTSLTILGMVIGVASVTVVLALGEGAKEKVRWQASQLGSNLLTVRPGKATRDKAGNIVDYNFLAALGSSTLSERDLESITQTKGIASAAPLMAITGSIASDPDKPPAKNAQIIATTPSGDEALRFKIRSGDFISDVTNRDTVVLGAELASEMLGSDTAIGRKVVIRGQEFTVIGILSHYGVGNNLSNWFDFNHVAFIPLDAGKSFNQGIAQIQQINARVNDGQDPKNMSKTLQQTILDNHGKEEDFTVMSPEETLPLADTMLHLVTVLTSAIAGISLIVGGVGIMNIMLVSVTERTREIGIRKSVGATNGQVLRQFLIESLLMSLTGGFIGIALAYGIAFGVGTLVDLLPVITWQIICTAVGIATVIGIVFGLMPALKAARKDPIEALRQFQ